MSERQSDYAQIGFLDDDTLAIFFNTAATSAATPVSLRSLFLDSRTGSVLRAADWQADSLGSYFQPTMDGRFLWHMSKRGPLDWIERLALYTPDLKVAKERNAESHSLTLSHTRETMLLARESRSPTGWRNDIEIVDAASLDTIYALTDADGSDNLTVYDNYNSLLVRTTRPLHSGRGEISIQSIGKPPHVVYTSTDRNCYPHEAYFLTSNVLFVNQECPVWLLMTASGEVVHAEKMDKNEDIDQPFTTQPAPSETSYDGKRFALLVSKRKAGLFEERALAHTVAQRVVVFDTDTKRQIFEYRIKPLPQQRPAVALSPGGNRLAVFSDGHLQVFAIQ